MPSGKSTLVVPVGQLVLLVALAMGTATAASMQRSLGQPTDNQSLSFEHNATTTSPNASAVPATTTRPPTPPPASTTPPTPPTPPTTQAPVTVQAPPSTPAPPPTPDHTAPYVDPGATQEPDTQSPTAESNATSTRSSKEVDEPQPKAVATAKRSSINAYVSVVAAIGTALTVASAAVVYHKAGMADAECDGDDYFQSKQRMQSISIDEAEVSDSSADQLRFSLPSTVATTEGNASAAATLQQSSELFVVEESKDGDR